MMALTRRILRQISGDKRTVALIVLAPLLILTLLHLLLGETTYTPTIALDPQNVPPNLLEAFETQDAVLLHTDMPAGFDAAYFLSTYQHVDAVFAFTASGIEITLYESGTKSASALQAIRGATASLNPAANMDVAFVIGSVDEGLFDAMGFAFLAIISFFLIFIVSGMALVRERSAGTLERLLMTPISRWRVVIGYTLGYSVFAVIQAVILVLFSLFVLGISNEGNLLWVVLIMVLLAITAVSFGKFISIFANTEFQVVQFIPIAIIPQIFFSGIVPLDTFPAPLGNLGYLMPVFYGSSAIRQVMRVGSGFQVIWPYLLALVAYILILSLLNAVALKKYRKL